MFPTQTHTPNGKYGYVKPTSVERNKNTTLKEVIRSWRYHLLPIRRTVDMRDIVDDAILQLSSAARTWNYKTDHYLGSTIGKAYYESYIGKPDFQLFFDGAKTVNGSARFICITNTPSYVLIEKHYANDTIIQIVLHDISEYEDQDLFRVPVRYRRSNATTHKEESVKIVPSAQHRPKYDSTLHETIAYQLSNQEQAKAQQILSAFFQKVIPLSHRFQLLTHFLYCSTEPILAMNMLMCYRDYLEHHSSYDANIISGKTTREYRTHQRSLSCNKTYYMEPLVFLTFLLPLTSTHYRQ